MEQQKSRSRELTELCGRVAQWRKQEGGGRGAQIPEVLWLEAMRVVRLEGLYPTARALRFNYARLKERCGAEDAAKTPATRTAEAPRAPEPPRGNGSVVDGGVSDKKSREPVPADGALGARFVALPVPPPRMGSQTSIELVRPNGDRLRIEVLGELDVATLVQTLWSRPS